jgi:hypothetical protein
LAAGRAIKFTTEAPLILSTPPHQAPLPTEIALAQNYPNPFNPETTIEFALPQNDVVKLAIFDVLGREVTTLMNGPMTAGQHQITWHGKFSDGSSAASGIYFYRLATAQTVMTRKMILLR